jgi:hypothetical protein
MMANVPHVTSGLGLREFQADGFLLTRVYVRCLCCSYLGFGEGGDTKYLYKIVACNPSI